MKTYEFRDAYMAEHPEQFKDGGIFLGQCGCQHVADDHCPHCGHCNGSRLHPGDPCGCERFEGK